LVSRRGEERRGENKCSARRHPMAWGGGLFLSLGRPTREQQKACLAEAGGFNYDAALHGATRTTETSGGGDAAPAAALAERGFSVNRWRVQIGSGAGTFQRARSALRSWRHLALGWADVEAGTPVEVGTRFCICYREAVIPFPRVWVMLPLQVAYVESESPAAFAFGSGTLQGHLLVRTHRRIVASPPPCDDEQSSSSSSSSRPAPGR
jgi:uncharacterized protein (UPF0548 family)